MVPEGFKMADFAYDYEAKQLYLQELAFWVASKGAKGQIPLAGPAISTLNRLRYSVDSR